MLCLLDRYGDFPDRVDGGTCRPLDFLNSFPNFICGCGSLLGEVLDLRRDNRESLSSLAGARSFDCSIEC